MLSLVLVGVGPQQAHAEGADEFKLLANVGVTHDSNLFRLSRNANTQALLGRSSAAETIMTSTLGMRYDKSYSLQRVVLDLNYNKYDYQNFKYLSYSGLNYRAAWEWSYTPRLHGTLSTSRNQTLNSFLDFRGFNVRNQRVDRTTRLDATYELDARWRVIGGVSVNKRTNELPIVQEADFSNSALDVGLSYVMPSGSSATYTLRRTEGDLLNRPFPSVGFNDRTYEQIDHSVQANWALSSSASATFRLGHRSRTHPNYPQRDFDGMTGGATFNWSFSPKAALAASWNSELDSYESANTNFRRINRLAVGPTWQLGTKTALRAQVEQVTYNYDGSPGPLAPSSRRDTTNNISLSLDWQPYRFVSFNASLQNGRRSANQPGLDFDANTISFQAQFTY